MVWQVAVAATVLLCAALSGCTASTGDTQTAPDGLQATDTTGILRGVVVDDAIRPLVGATVTARGAGVERVTATDADGAFGFAGLAPGTWIVSAAKVAYTEAQQSVEVVAGEDAPPLVKLLLVFVPDAVPFYTEVKMEAFVQCIIPGANLCAIINLYPCIVAGYCEPIVEDTSFILLYDHLVSLARMPDWLQTEVVWESTQSVSPALSIRYSPYGPEGGGGITGTQDRLRGVSPLVYRLDPGILEEWKIGIENGLLHEFFGHMEETSAAGSFGVVLNQRVALFSHAFYGYAPPETWQFSQEPVPQPPE